MVSVTLKRLMMVSDRIVDYRSFITFHRSGPTIIFSILILMEDVSDPSKKLQIKSKFIRNLIKIVSVTLEGLRMVSDKIVDFRYFVKFHRSGPAIIFNFELSWRILVIHQKSS